MQMPVSTLRGAGCCCRLWGNEEQLVTVWGKPLEHGETSKEGTEASEERNDSAETKVRVTTAWGWNRTELGIPAPTPQSTWAACRPWEVFRRRFWLSLCWSLGGSSGKPRYICRRLKMAQVGTLSSAKNGCGSRLQRTARP